jgi:Predicted nucleic acid-binding protein, contains PIN domain
MGRCWVVDASPIILLSKADHIDLLSACTEGLLVPAVVADEVREGGENDPARQWLGAREERFVDATGPVASDVAAWDLGRGESRVLSYGLRHEGWTAVVDDGVARRCAKGVDIAVIGTLGVLVVAKTDGHLEAVGPAVRALRRAGLHVSADIVNHVLQMAGEA